MLSRMMEPDLLGTLLLATVFVPYTVEVVWQLRLLTRFLTALPPPVRAALPAHPRRPWLATAGSTRFFLALWRCARRDAPDDTDGVRSLKREIRASLRRELVYGASAAALVVILVVNGWRPVWP